jgi:putative holliday junction resolvase
MSSGRIMALDVGDSRIGIAFSDPSRMLASPHSIVARADGQPAERIATLAKAEAISLILIGLPKNMDGSTGSQARKVQTFAKQMQEHLPDRDIVFWDERLTTRHAVLLRREGGAGKQKRAKPIDDMAAAVLLQSYLDFCRQQVSNTNI